jgi:lipoate-protein ligase A
MNLRFIEHFGYPGAFHMAVDEILLATVGSGKSPPTLRAYTWRPYAVSLGRSQRQSFPLDAQKCRQAGVDVVVRPSGGRAVLHGDDVTYSAVFPADGILGAGGIGATYRRLAAVLLQALAYLGVEADLARSRAVNSSGAALPCFTAAARDEVLVGGRKLIGSAQRRTKSAVLQHGSILMRGDQTVLTSLLADEAGAADLRKSLAGRTITLEEILGRSVSFSDVAGALRKAAAVTFDAEIIQGELSDEEVSAVGGAQMTGSGAADLASAQPGTGRQI